MDKKEKEITEVVEEKKVDKVKDTKKEEKFERILDEKEKVKSSPLKIIGNVIFWGAFIVFVILAIVAYLNYNRLENDEEPAYYSSMEEYKIDDEGNKLDKNADEGENVTVYNYYIYKVVEHYNNDGRQVSLKLWFLDDVTKD